MAYRGRGFRREGPWRQRYEPALYVLDYLELGNPSDIHYEHRNQPLVQGVGVKYFSLLEATPLPAVRIDILERIELGGPSKVKRVIHVGYSELTSVARANLPEALRLVVIENERVFTEFFNIAEPVNIRLHALELLPDIGKKTMNQILEERSRKKFESFSDIRERTRVDPVKALIGRIIKELEGGEKYYLFIKPKEPGALYLGYLEKLYGESF
ncbi:MAG: DUF655 domain-containing protein [Desulfurococcus sp.]|nr:DUF655 domain-containing protein [Desulfurococcus sp.]